MAPAAVQYANHTHTHSCTSTQLPLSVIVFAHAHATTLFTLEPHLHTHSPTSSSAMQDGTRGEKDSIFYKCKKLTFDYRFEMVASSWPTPESMWDTVVTHTLSHTHTQTLGRGGMGDARACVRGTEQEQERHQAERPQKRGSADGHSHTHNTLPRWLVRCALARLTHVPRGPRGEVTKKLRKPLKIQRLFQEKTTKRNTTYAHDTGEVFLFHCFFTLHCALWCVLCAARFGSLCLLPSCSLLAERAVSYRA